MADKEKNEDPKRPEQITLYFTEIIKTENLSKEISSKIRDDLISEDLYKPSELPNEKKGFYEKFIYKKQTNCDMDFLGVEKEFWSGKPLDDKISNKYDSNNSNHVKLYKLNYVKTNLAEKKSSFVDIFLIPSFDLIFVCGAESHSEEPIKYLKNKLKSIKQDEKFDFDYKSLNIDPKFLLWLVYKKKLTPNGKINENLKILNFTKFDTERPDEEDNDEVPNNILTADNNQKDLSFPIIYGIINKLIISELLIKFFYLKARLIIGFKVDIKKKKSFIRIHSKSSIKNKDYCGKIKLSLPFLNEIIIEYLTWSKLKSNEKIPDIKFIDELKDKLFDEYENTVYNFINFREEHCELLGEECPKLPPIYLFDNKSDIDKYDDETKNEIKEKIEYLVDKNVLLYLQNK